MKNTLIVLLTIIFLGLTGFFLHQIIKLSSPTPDYKPAESVLESTPTASPEPIKSSTPTQPVRPKSNVPSITPTPQPDGNTYACDPQGVCNAYQNANAADCPQTFLDSRCDNQCANVTIRCQQ